MKVSEVESGEISKGSSSSSPSKRMKRGLAIMDFILRIFAATSTLGSAVSMGTAKQTMPFATRFVRFKVVYHDLPTFVFFVTANSIVCGYLVLSLALSFFHIVRTISVKSRILLVFLDTVMFGLLTSGASAAAAIVNIAHYGNSSANWFPFCQQYNYFCGRISGSLIGSFIAVVVFIILILMSEISISKH
ncbi:casparian strip membrane protein 2 [Trifolium pratense]|uniref:casparian strip membrane protein 2 n=1 Tax=Trifolium pratense TaxID=57577 RepID=UPI001E695068|nr:casparian strip membrane protein 2 [Trifolium pratense]